MKKNKMMRAASGLMVATLLTTSIISGTFAKYTTEDSGSDTARVAKWGINVSASGNLFGKEYAKVGADNNGNSIVVSGNESTVKANDKVVAPGTKNETGFTLSIKGTPEVAYSVNAESVGTVKDIFLGAGDWGVMVEATGLNAASNVEGLYTKDISANTYTKVGSGSWTQGITYYELKNHVELTNSYYPIKWTVKNAGNNTEAINETFNLVEIANTMVEKIKSLKGGAGNTIDASYTLTWEWLFDNQKNAADTILGDLQVDSLENGTVVYAADTPSSAGTTETTYSSPTSDKYNLDINFGMKVTVTQVD